MPTHVTTGMGHTRICVACCDRYHSAHPTEGLLLCPYTGNCTPTHPTHPHSRHVYPQGRPLSAPGCTYRYVNAVMALHSLGSVPLTLLPSINLQVGRAHTSGGGMHAPHDSRPKLPPRPGQPGLCFTAAALCVGATIPPPALSGVASAMSTCFLCVMLCVSCKPPSTNTRRSGSALLPNQGSLLHA
jgi:hypothetical protein